MLTLCVDLGQGQEWLVLLTVQRWRSRGQGAAATGWSAHCLACWFAQGPPPPSAVFSSLQTELPVVMAAHCLCHLPQQFSHRALVGAIGSVSQSLEDLQDGQGGRRGEGGGIEHLVSVHRPSRSVDRTSHLHQRKWINKNKTPTKQLDCGSTVLPFPTSLLSGHGEQGVLGPCSLRFWEYYTFIFLGLV